MATTGYVSASLIRAKESMLALSDADRAYLRRWLNKFTDELGRIRRDHDELPDRGCPD